jgi:hypothetical protein
MSLLHKMLCLVIRQFYHYLYSLTSFRLLQQLSITLTNSESWATAAEYIASEFTLGGAEGDDAFNMHFMILEAAASKSGFIQRRL